LQLPYVSAGGPGGNNFLNMVSPGGGGSGNPYGFAWEITESDTFQDPDDLYVRFYFRVHQSWIDSSDNNMHWLQSTPNRGQRTPTGFYIIMSLRPDEFPEMGSEWGLQIEKYGAENGKFSANIGMVAEQWYCYEIHIEKIDEDNERWTIRIDGVDVVEKYWCSGGPQWGNWLEDLYAASWYFSKSYHGTLWLTMYDQEDTNDGWDVAAIEVRDDTWPGLLGDPDPDTTDPTVVSATSISATLVDVLFDEAMDGATIQAGDFSIDNGLTVSGAVLQGDNVTVRLTTSSQTPSTTYTVTVSTVSDIAGNPIGTPNTAQFTGFVVVEPELIVLTIVQAGVEPALTAAAVGGNSFDNDGRTFFHVDNASGSLIWATFAAQNNCSLGQAHDIAVAVPAGEERMIGPFEKHIYNDNNDEVVVTYSNVTTVTVGATKLP
jgi:hypothetical protein